MPIENVSDTARWVAVYRGMETARPDALFRDRFADRLAGPEGLQIVKEMKKGRDLAWPMIVRTAVFDELILDRVKNFGVDTVINLAAGLDTRPWRLALPASLRWFDVDLPEMTEYKATAMRGETTSCIYEAIAVDLRDAEARAQLFARIDAAATTTLVIAEGLLIYLNETQVAALARSIALIKSARWWLIDLASTRLLTIMNRHWGAAATAGSASFQFAPVRGTAFFEEFGWREAEFRSGMYEAHRLRREMRMAPVWRLLARISSAARRAEFQRMSGYVMLERSP